ncbi:MAG TPA: hypothetical protein VD962_12670 [Rubricoccaceae bacterium]|nr:hypothetical protein [Rubricoccaceae bacterium]
MSANAADVPEEVYLSFRYRGGVDAIVSVLYQDGTFALPVTELFSLLLIPHVVDTGAGTIHGEYPESRRAYLLHFREHYAEAGGRHFPLDATEAFAYGLDYYVHPRVLAELFGLRFTVNTAQLSLSLATDDVLPVVLQMERRRSYAHRPRQPALRGSYPLAFGRARDVINGAFLDYAFHALVRDGGPLASSRVALGGEVLGGDLQAFFTGAYTPAATVVTARDVRWRYVMPDRPWLRSVAVGQQRLHGLAGQPYLGVRLSNEPIAPRDLFDQYVIEGAAEPGAEVELYLDTRLLEVQQADALGYYRFLVPLGYGTSAFRLRIYSPTGAVREVDRSVEVPVAFLPPGAVSYTVSAGRLDQPPDTTATRRLMAQADAAVGVTGWLTARSGVEYFEGFHEGRPLLFQSLMARLAARYVITADLAPAAFYRLSASALYPSAAGWTLGFTSYTADGVYNRLQREQELRATLFLPFAVGSVPLTARFSGERQTFAEGALLSLSADLHARLGRANVGFGYREGSSSRDGRTIVAEHRLSAAAAYTFPSASTLPAVLEGTYLRAQVAYQAGAGALERVALQATRTVVQGGRLALSVGHDFVRRTSLFEAGLSFDLHPVRTASSVRIENGGVSFSQSTHGSVGYDRSAGQFVVENRPQVGRAAAAVRLFVDTNRSGAFDEGEEVIHDDAVRLEGSGARRVDAAGVTRLTLLQPYTRYNVEINEAALSNPLLVPEISRFSFIADPNAYTELDVPFVVTGVVEGIVLSGSEGAHRPVGGIRVLLRNEDDGTVTTLRTFSDGRFYAMGVRPGRYTATVDATQLELLALQANPTALTFEVLALPEGDALEGLRFDLSTPLVESEETDEAP